MLFIDFETSSNSDIRNVGGHVYAADPSTRIVCMAYAFDGEEVQLWTPDQELPMEVYTFMAAGGLISAWNVSFERSIIENNGGVFPKVDPRNYRCTMSRAASVGLPSSLKECAKVMNTELKDEAGQRAMRVVSNFDKFMTKTPEKREELLKTTHDYCKQDVEVERALSLELPKLSAREFKIWQLDQKINHAGLPIDLELCHGVKDALAVYLEEVAKRVPELTNGEIEKPTQVARIKKYCLEHGVEVETLGAEALQGLLDGELPDNVRELLEIRQKTSKASTAKFSKMIEMAPNGKAYGTLKYFGAATGRWSGKGLQPQNLPRPTGDVESFVKAFKDGTAANLPDVYNAAKSCLRAAIAAPEGHSFVVLDYSGIEARVLAWLAGDLETCEKLRSGVDLYKDMAATIYGVDLGDVSSEQRQVGKAAILGLGYGMGANKFLGELQRFDPSYEHGFAQDVVATYRNKYKHIRRYWYMLEAGAAKQVDMNTRGGGVAGSGWSRLSRWTRYRLTSGRYLHYMDLSFQTGSRNLSYKKSLTARAGRMYDTNIYSGKFAENVVQAVARDVLADAMLTIDQAGHNIISTIHDEVVVLVRDEDAQKTYDSIEAIMESGSSWTKGLPLAVEGYISKRFKK